MSLTTLNTDIALISLADLKAILGIASADTSQDSQLTACINSASKAIQTYLGRGWLIKNYSADTTEVFDGNGRNRLHVNYPIVSLTSVTVTHLPTGSTTVYTSSGLTIRNSVGIVQIPPKIGTEVSPVDVGVFSQGFQNISVIYRYGWNGITNVPEDVALACADVVTFMRTGVQGGGKKAERIGNYAVTYGSPVATVGVGAGMITPLARTLLQPYKRIVITTMDSEAFG